MRLLHCEDSGRFVLTEDLPPNDVPPYAILSHTWGSEEVVFADLATTPSDWQQKAGFNKIKFCAEQARRDGLEYFWVDTCCIDKSNAVELQTAINSMFRWYRDSRRCYVYLADVSAISASDTQPSQTQWEDALRDSRWFTRGWTLQGFITVGLKGPILGGVEAKNGCSRTSWNGAKSPSYCTLGLCAKDFA